MHELEKHIEHQWGSLKDKKLFVACSGGLDSICLTYILQTLGFGLTVIHVNYQLRGQDSEEDARFVSLFCKEFSIPFISRTVDLNRQLKEGGNLQQIARDYRYNWFNELTSEHEDHYVVLAHHRDDQIETFLLNLSRKSGVMGLAAMPKKRGHIIRPLLDFSKNDLLNYAQEKGINWREDKSNASNKYRRNLLRNEIIPFLQSEISTLGDSVITLIEHFQAKQNELEESIAPVIRAIKETRTLFISRYESLDEFERVELFRQLGQTASKSSELLNLSKAQKGKRIELTLTNENPFSQIVKENDSFVFVPDEKVTKDYALVQVSVDAIPDVFNKDEVYLDTNRINGVLKLRPWQIGDRMKPLGMSGSKLISDIIAEAQISALEKENILVLQDDVEILWCVGLKVGAKAIANSNSNQIIKCSVTCQESPK